MILDSESNSSTISFKSFDIHDRIGAPKETFGL